MANYSDIFPLNVGGSSIAGFNWTEKTADFTAVANEAYYCDTALGDILMTLPSNPSPGDEVAFLLIGANALNITTTDNIKSAPLVTDFVKLVTENYLMFVWSYVDGTVGWNWDARYDSFISNVYIGGGIPLLFSSFKDTNGLFYYLGTNGNTASFTNPSGGSVTVTESSSYSGSMTGVQTLDRDDATFWQSAGGASQWVSYRIINKFFSLEEISIKSRSTSHYISSYFNPLIVQYSTNGVDWITLDTFTPTGSLWQNFTISSPVFSEYYRLFCDGTSNYKIIGDVEFYGNLLL